MRDLFQRDLFQVDVDARAREWLDAHPASGPRVIAYDVHRCCGGGKICLVNVRDRGRSDKAEDYATGVMADGTGFLIDRRAAARLPARFTLTVRGFGPLQRLDLDLAGDQWGELLYS